MSIEITSVIVGDWGGEAFGIGLAVAVCVFWGARRYWVKGYWERGCAALEKGDLAGAEKAFRKFVRSVPALAMGHRALGTTLARQGKLEAAEEHFVLATQLEPKTADGYVDLGFFLLIYNPGRAEEAIEAFANAVRLAPDLRKQLRQDTRLAPLRAHERFLEIVAETDEARQTQQPPSGETSP